MQQALNNRYQIHQESLANNRQGQLMRPLGFIHDIETERAIIHGNRELIRLHEEKVKKVIERVWES